MTLQGGSSQACAACKFRRRKCSSECELAPYFPADQTKIFQNAHKLFGVRNIIKILENLDAPQKEEAMSSIKYEANIRDKFPVDGCLGIIRHFKYQIRQLEEELNAVHAQLEMYRQHPHHAQISTLADDVASQLVLGMAPPNNGLTLFGHTNPVNALPVSQNHSYSNATNSSYLDSKDSLWLHHNNNNNNNSMSMSIQSQPLPIQQGVPDYDEIHPFFDTIDDRQSYFESKEACDSSSEESMKDTTQSMEHGAANELKSAAACFSLTSVN